MIRSTRSLRETGVFGPMFHILRRSRAPHGATNRSMVQKEPHEGLHEGAQLHGRYRGVVGCVAGRSMF